MIQDANATLVHALIKLTRGQEGFKNLENHAAYTAHQDAFDVILNAEAAVLQTFVPVPFYSVR
jgi:hypothetical protein